MTKTWLITGCSTGFGRLLAEAALKRGDQVVATARDPASLSDMAKTFPKTARAAALDVTKPGAAEKAVALAVEAFGKLDILVNNAGFGFIGAIEEATPDEYRPMFETNVFGLIETTRAALPAMRKTGAGGRIVNMSSGAGIKGLQGSGHYNATKFAVEGISDTLRLELAGTGISVSLVEPGPIVSRFRENCLAPFMKHIDWQHSIHRQQYEGQMARLNKPGPAAPFTLPPEAVLAKVIHALESSRPRARYPVTVPSVLFWWLKRLLPVRTMDRVLIRASGGGKR